MWTDRSSRLGKSVRHGQAISTRGPSRRTEPLHLTTALKVRTIAEQQRMTVLHVFQPVFARKSSLIHAARLREELDTTKTSLAISVYPNDAKLARGVDSLPPASKFPSS